MTVQANNAAIPNDNELLERVRRGDQIAVAILYNRYGDRLVRVFSRRISSRFQAKVDPEDIWNSAVGSFCRRAKDGQFELEEGNDLWRLLKTIGLNKLRRHVRRGKTQRRDVGREVPLATPEGKENPYIADSRDPLPLDERVAIKEIVEKLQERLRGPEKSILAHRLAGLKHSEIAKQTGFSDRTVRRILNDRIPDKAREWFPECCGGE